MLTIYIHIQLQFLHTILRILYLRYDIQNDDDYIEKYNKTKEFYIKEYPTIPREEKYQNISKCRKNISDKEIIFYQDHDTTYWETENKRSYKK